MNKIVRAVQVITTWQGEGKNKGMRMLLIRYKHCNRADGMPWPGFDQEDPILPCSFCDTIVTMKSFAESEFHLTTLQEIIDEQELVGPLITGGEPTFGINLGQSILALNQLKYKMADIETNGFNLPKLIEEVHKNKNINFTLSPKIFSTNDMDFYQNLINNIKNEERLTIKYVYRNMDQDIVFMNFLRDINFDNSRIYLMPEGKNREEILANSPKVFDAAEIYRVNFSSRDHIIYEFI